MPPTIGKSGTNVKNLEEGIQFISITRSVVQLVLRLRKKTPLSLFTHMVDLERLFPEVESL